MDLDINEDDATLIQNLDFDSSHKIIQNVLMLPSSIDITILHESKRDEVIHEICEILPRVGMLEPWVLPRTKIHMHHALNNGFDPVDGLCEDLLPEFGYKNNLHTSHLSGYSHLLLGHAMRMEEKAAEEERYLEQLRRCTVEQPNNNEIEEQNRSHKYRELVDKQQLIVIHYETLMDMFEDWSKCTELIYWRNETLANENKNKTFKDPILSNRYNIQPKHLNTVADINHLLLTRCRNICLRLLDNLKHAVHIGVDSEPLLDQSCVMQCIVMTFQYVPTYLRCMNTHTDPPYVNMKEYYTELRYCSTTTTSANFEQQWWERQSKISYWLDGDDVKVGDGCSLGPYDEGYCPYVMRLTNDWKSLL